MSAPRPQCQPTKATPVCCYCDNDLSCASCGMEQPYDDISVAKARIQDLEAALRRAREIVNAIVLSTHSVSFTADLKAIDAALNPTGGA